MQKRKYLLKCLLLILLIIPFCFTNQKESANSHLLSKIDKDTMISSSLPIATLLKDHTIFEKETPIAKLIIKKINLENNLYEIGTKENNVDKNVMILKESIFPDKEQSILFIAAHSGTGKTAYFRNLDKLSLGDTAEIIYKNYKYRYEISNIYEKEKNGYIEGSRSSKHQLVLTTCSQKSKDKQLIMNAKLIGKDEI